ncbi:MAG: EamA family transporter, partial [Alphaproteobacteria bacterium]
MPETRPARRSALLPVAGLLLLGTMWGGNFSLAKIATTAGVHPFGLLLWQASGGALIVVAFCAARGRLRFLRRRYIGYYAGCGALGVVAPSSAIYWSAAHVPAGVLALLATTVPFVTYGLALAVGIERFRWLRVAG